MNEYENRLSDYIDTLNAEHKPKEHEEVCDSKELEKLLGTVRQVRSLKEAALPDAGYPEMLAKSTAGQSEKGKKSRGHKRTWFTGLAAAVAAILIMTVILSNISTFSTPNYAYAMEKAYEGIKSYRGLLEITTENTRGESDTQTKLEVWADKKGHYYVKQLEGSQKDVVTVNNGERKWQIVPEGSKSYTEGKRVNIFPAFPDPYRFSFEIGKEIEQIKSAVSTKTAGEETIAGRQASILEVTPEGGDPYRIWVDKETKLPLKKESAWNNALKYTVTYTKIEFSEAIPSELMTYKLPEGFKEVNSNPEFRVANIGEAQNIAGFIVKVPEGIPAGYAQRGIVVETEKNIVKLYYAPEEDSMDARIVLFQGKAKGEFKPVSNSILGKVNDMQAEIQSPVQLGAGIIDSSSYAGVTGLTSIRWQQYGKEYAVVGNVSLEVLSAFVRSISGGEVKISIPSEQPINPQIKVPVDLEVAKNDQKSVDGGHSPWQLNPVFVAQVFVSLKISPEGITGEYPVQMENLKVIKNTGAEAIIEVKGEKAPLSKVYLKRLIRQDASGIWSVVGYDLVK